MNEFDAHESSYDHQHKKRLKDMKDMQRQVQTANRKEEKGPLMSIKLGGSSAKSTSSGGFKKGGFKNAFGSVEDDSSTAKKEEEADDNVFVKKGSKNEIPIEEEQDSDITDQDDYYDPRKPTGCMPGCPGVVA